MGIRGKLSFGGGCCAYLQVAPGAVLLTGRGAAGAVHWAGALSAAGGPFT